MKKIAIAITIVIFIFSPTQLRAEEFFTSEIGIIAQVRDFEFNNINPLSVTQIGYGRKKDNKYLHLFWGSLDGGVHNHRTGYIFGELGYQEEFKEDYFWAVSLGIGRVAKTSDYFTSNNMYTQSIKLGYKDYYLSLRHLSNGQEYLGNPDPNYGREFITIGKRY